MLFIFENEAPRSFWMKNTFVPLSIAFFDLKKRINSILDMAPAARVSVMGRPELTKLYAAALTLAGHDPVELDGEQSFLAGIQHIAERIA